MGWLGQSILGNTGLRTETKQREMMPKLMSQSSSDAETTVLQPCPGETSPCPFAGITIPETHWLEPGVTAILHLHGNLGKSMTGPSVSFKLGVSLCSDILPLCSTSPNSKCWKFLNTEIPNGKGFSHWQPK